MIRFTLYLFGLVFFQSQLGTFILQDLTNQDLIMDLSVKIETLRELIACKSREINEKQKIKIELAVEVEHLKQETISQDGEKLIEATTEPQPVITGPITLFPMEVLDMISRKLAASSDMFNMHATCRPFRKLLASRKTLFLFKKVLPFLLPHLDTPAALCCRMVCKIWKTDFDEYVETRFMHENLTPVKNDPETLVGSSRCIRALENSYVFTNRPYEYLQAWRFVEMSTLHRESSSNESPFIGNGMKLVMCTNSHLAVEFDFGDEEDDDPSIDEREQIFWSQIRIILKEFGKHLTTLQVHVSNTTLVADAADVAHLLYHDLLVGVGNLKRLLFSGCLVPIPRGHVWPQLDNLPNIHTLQIDEMRMPVYGDVSPQQFHAMVKNLMQTRLPFLTRLLLPWNIWREWQISTLDWSRLLELRLSGLNDDAVEVNLIANARVLNLRELRLEPGIGNIRTAGIAFRKVFSMVASGGVLCSRSRLQTVRVWNGFPAKELGCVAKPAFSEISNVVIEEINEQNYYGPARFNFLLHFVSLKSVKIVWPLDGYQEILRNGLIAVARRYSRRPEDVLGLNQVIADKRMTYKISIWRLLPTLDIMCIQDDVYTRRRYENCNHNNM